MIDQYLFYSSDHYVALINRITEYIRLNYKTFSEELTDPNSKFYLSQVYLDPDKDSFRLCVQSKEDMDKPSDERYRVWITASYQDILTKLPADLPDEVKSFLTENS